MHTYSKATPTDRRAQACKGMSVTGQVLRRIHPSIHPSTHPSTHPSIHPIWPARGDALADRLTNERTNVTFSLAVCYHHCHHGGTYNTGFKCEIQKSLRGFGIDKRSARVFCRRWLLRCVACADCAGQRNMHSSVETSICIHRRHACSLACSPAVCLQHIAVGWMAGWLDGKHSHSLPLSSVRTHTPMRSDDGSCDGAVCGLVGCGGVFENTGQGAYCHGNDE